MTTTSLSKPLRGIVPPLITPLLDRDTLNREGLERLIERVRQILVELGMLS